MNNFSDNHGNEIKYVLNKKFVLYYFTSFYIYSLYMIYSLEIDDNDNVVSGIYLSHFKKTDVQC